MKYMELRHYCPRVMDFGKLEKYKSPYISQNPEYLIQTDVEECLLWAINLIILVYCFSDRES
jgi:hypothetical protein